MSISKHIETTADIATLAAAVLLTAVLVKGYFLPSAPPSVPLSSTSVTTGVSLQSRLPGVDFRKNGRTLLLAISTTCHFCMESEPFYRKLRDEAGKGLKTVAVLPQPTTESEQYLNGEGVHVDQVRQAELSSLGVQGTPTLLLVDGAGVVTKVWVGKLKPEQEQEVIATLKRG